MENKFDIYDQIVVIQGVLKSDIHNLIKSIKNDKRSLIETNFPLVDIVISDEVIKVFAELPGINLNDINVYLCGDLLIIEGEKKLEKIPYKVHFIRMERSTSYFRRIIQLPKNVREDNIKAKLKDGVLHIEFIKEMGE